VIVVIVLAQIFKQFFSAIIIKSIENFTSKTKTDLDDKLIKILKQPLNWLIFISGVWLARLLIVDYLNPTLQEATDSLINLIAIAIVAWIIYRAAPLLGQLLSNLALQTETELDDLIVPYLPKLFQTLAIAIFALKTGEVVLDILKLMEQEGIKLFTSTPIAILPTSTELPEQIHQF